VPGFASLLLSYSEGIPLEQTRQSIRRVFIELEQSGELGGKCLIATRRRISLSEAFKDKKKIKQF
jgi:hypothetical protein